MQYFMAAVVNFQYKKEKNSFELNSKKIYITKAVI